MSHTEFPDPPPRGRTRRITAAVAIVCIAGAGVIGFVAGHNTGTNAKQAAKLGQMIAPPPSLPPGYSPDGNGRLNGSGFATLGMGVPGGDPANVRIAQRAGLRPEWVRLYANAIPASLKEWPDAQAAVDMGLRVWLSVTPQVDRLAAGDYDAALTQFVATLPAGTRLTTNHEPSNRSKGITAQAFDAGWNHGARVILDGSHGAVEPWAIEIQANVIKDHYLDGLDPALVNRGGIGLDGYDGIQGAATAVKSFEQVASASFAYTTKTFPDAHVGFAEFNSSRTTGWARWVADALTWANSVHADVAVLFTSLDQWRKTPAELHRLALILNAA